MMPVICRACAVRMDVKVPPLRVSRSPCQICGKHEPGQDRNYSVDAMQIPGSDADPNRQAEKEDARN